MKRFGIRFEARMGAAIAAAAATLTCAFAANAAPNVLIELDAEPGCPDRGDLFGELQKRVPNAAMTELASADYFARVRLAPAGTEYEGKLELAPGGARRAGSTEATVRTVRGGTCAEVGEALALVLALAVEQSEEAAKADAAEKSEPPPPPATPEPAPTKVRFAAMGHVSVRSGLVTSYAPGGGIGLELRQTGRGPFAPSARLLAGFASDDFFFGTSSGNQRALMQAGMITLDGCGLRASSPSETLAVDLCVRVEFGVIGGSVRPDGESGQTANWLVLGPALRGRWTLFDRLFLELEASAGGSVIRNQWLLGGVGSPYFETPPIVTSFGSSFGVSIL